MLVLPVLVIKLFPDGHYSNALLQPGVSKAQALRQAQIALLKNKNLANPFYDIYHDTVKRALQKDGWIITHDPFTLRYSLYFPKNHNPQSQWKNKMNKKALLIQYSHYIPMENQLCMYHTNSIPLT